MAHFILLGISHFQPSTPSLYPPEADFRGAIPLAVPMSQDVAVTTFEELEEKRLDFEDAFPGVKIEEA